MSFHPSRHDVLLIVDMQNDFLPGGALAVPGGDALIPAINELTHAPFRSIIASQDWHPPQHCSFNTQGGPWPPHCIAGTKGAALHAALHTAPISHLIHKGMNPHYECYSAFAYDDGTSTGLAGLLTGLQARRVMICGVALDYCVRASALDSQRAGFETFVMPQLCRAISNPAPILTELKNQGITLI